MLVSVNISPDFWTARFVNALVLRVGLYLRRSHGVPQGWMAAAVALRPKRFSGWLRGRKLRAEFTYKLQWVSLQQVESSVPSFPAAEVLLLVPAGLNELNGKRSLVKQSGPTSLGSGSKHTDISGAVTQQKVLFLLHAGPTVDAAGLSQHLPSSLQPGLPGCLDL